MGQETSRKMENIPKLEEDLKEKDEERADVTVVCGEDTYHLHSKRLAQKSKFFKTALDIPMKEKQEKKIEVKDVDPEIFGKVVHYMYHETLQFDKETHLENILDAAERFDMEELKDEIGKQMVEALDKENVFYMAGLAELYNANLLLSKCIGYVVKENISIKEEDVKKHPNVCIGIIEKLRKHLDKKKEDIEIMKEKLEEAAEVLAEEACETLHRLGYSGEGGFYCDIEIMKEKLEEAQKKINVITGEAWEALMR